MNHATLRSLAVARSLVCAESIGAAVERIGFVQADPIRAPARAQDLILRHRVAGYRAGGLEAAYPGLPLDEGVLYAYGFVGRGNAGLLVAPCRPLSTLERAVLDVVADLGVAHPRDLDQPLGRRTERNAWGGSSRATNHALQALHGLGRLRVAGRRKGIRCYAVAPSAAPIPPAGRMRALILLAVHVLAPIRRSTLRGIAARFRSRAGPGVDHVAAMDGMVADGVLTAVKVDGVRYLWPADDPPVSPPQRVVRLLAPFDPVVWDRARFEHLFGWSYRFEAYTPAAKRVRGYYALPMLFGDEVVGWANVASVRGELDVGVGFVAGHPPVDPDFAGLLEDEVRRLRAFLGPGPPA